MAFKALCIFIVCLRWCAVAHLRKIDITVKLAELELARRLGEVVSIDTVVATVAAHISSARSRLLSLPSKLAPALAIEDRAAECQELLESAICEVLTELGSGSFGEVPAPCLSHAPR
jgi:hypothetical protein